MNPLATSNVLSEGCSWQYAREAVESIKEVAERRHREALQGITYKADKHHRRQVAQLTDEAVRRLDEQAHDHEQATDELRREAVMSLKTKPPATYPTDKQPKRKPRLTMMR